MSLIRTAKQIIEDLGGLDPDTVLIGNLYSADDIRDSLDGYVDTEDGDEAIEKMTDEDVIGKFQDFYDYREEESFYNAMSDFGCSVDGDGDEDEEDEEN